MSIENESHKLSEIVAIRWFVNEIENRAIEAYMGNPLRMADVRGKLNETLDFMMALRIPGEDRLMNGPCPWDCGASNICRPNCLPAR